MNEIEKCKSNINYFIENYCLPNNIKLFDFQKRTLENLWNKDKDWSIIPKSRITAYTYYGPELIKLFELNRKFGK